MFETLTATPGDALLALIGAFRADPRPGKIDVGVGVYRDAHGATPVMAAVKQAEARLLASQDSKGYLGLVGSTDFNAAMVDQVLADAVPRTQVRAVQTPGGGGALRSLLDLVALSRPDATVWLSDPTWANHRPLVEAARLQVRTYPYFDPATQQVIAGARSSDGNGFASANPFGNTTIAVVATSAALTREQTNKMAQMAHDGMAQAIRPAHTMFDGDTIFALALGPASQQPYNPQLAAAYISAIGAAAATTLARAIVKAVRNATTLHGVPAVQS